MEEKKPDERLNKLEEKMKKALEPSEKSEKIAKDMMQKIRELHRLMEQYKREQIRIVGVEKRLMEGDRSDDIQILEDYFYKLQDKMTRERGFLPIEDVIVEMEAIERLIDRLKKKKEGEEK